MKPKVRKNNYGKILYKFSSQEKVIIQGWQSNTSGRAPA
jgi:hypothetical protein